MMDIDTDPALGRRSHFDFEDANSNAYEEEQGRGRRLNALLTIDALDKAIQAASGLSQHIDTFPTPPRHYREAIENI